MTSKDGFQWTKAEGLRQGVPSIGVISPESNISSSNAAYDVVIIGAGYTALTAARDVTLSGMLIPHIGASPIPFVLGIHDELN